ncbi:MAG: hypothetical protein F4X64_10240 [Chloroflexi bacterium]|nr:hypothetical protein [Chloroflexota bacterium]
MIDFPPMFAYRVTAALYRWFLVTYGTSAIGRMGVEAYKQIVIHKTAWYDVPTAAFAVLERGFIPHVLLSLAVAEVINMVLGEIFKERVRQERDKDWREWLWRKAAAERNGEPFDEPSPDEQPEESRRSFPFWRR